MSKTFFLAFFTVVMFSSSLDLFAETRLYIECRDFKVLFNTKKGIIFEREDGTVKEILKFSRPHSRKYQKSKNGTKFHLDFIKKGSRKTNGDFVFDRLSLFRDHYTEVIYKQAFNLKTE